MTEERCPLTELISTQCAHCRKLPDPAADLLRDIFEEPAQRQTGPWFSARYEGRCSECGMAFEVGDPIRPSGRGFVAPCCESPW